MELERNIFAMNKRRYVVPDAPVNFQQVKNILRDMTINVRYIVLKTLYPGLKPTESRRNERMSVWNRYDLKDFKLEERNHLAKFQKPEFRDWVLHEFEVTRKQVDGIVDNEDEEYEDDRDLSSLMEVEQLEKYISTGDDVRTFRMFKPEGFETSEKQRNKLSASLEKFYNYMYECICLIFDDCEKVMEEYTIEFNNDEERRLVKKKGAKRSVTFREGFIMEGKTSRALDGRYNFNDFPVLIEEPPFYRMKLKFSGDEDSILESFNDVCFAFWIFHLTSKMFNSENQIANDYVLDRGCLSHSVFAMMRGAQQSNDLMKFIISYFDMFCVDDYYIEFFQRTTDECLEGHSNSFISTNTALSNSNREFEKKCYSSLTALKETRMTFYNLMRMTVKSAFGYDLKMYYGHEYFIQEKKKKQQLEHSMSAPFPEPKIAPVTY
jgi:hypothetical protein